MLNQCSVFNFFSRTFFFFPSCIFLLFLLPVEAGLFFSPPRPDLFQINEEKETEPLPSLKAYELVENERTNEQNTTVNSSQKEPTDTQNSKNTVLLFFKTFFCLYPLRPLLAYWLAAVEWSSPPTAQWNWEETLQSAGQFSSDILSQFHSVVGKGGWGEGRGVTGRKARGRVIGEIRETTATIRKQRETPTVHEEK